MKSFQPNIVHEDNHLLIVNKPAGMLSQGDQTGDESLLDHYKKYIKEAYNKPGKVFLGLPHRIDRPVSGLVVLARTSKALERMTHIFLERKIVKTYWAMVQSRPPNESGALSDWLIKDHGKNITRVSGKKKKGAKNAVLEYNMLGRIGNYYLLSINPSTGRPHQIRVQLANIGCPIVGDIKYGFSKKNKDGSIQLHAKSLEFVHPVSNEPLNIHAHLPNSQLWSLFKSF